MPYFVFLLEFHDSGEINHGTFHRVKTLNDEKNLFPWTMSLGLSLTDDFSEQRLEALHVIMLEHPDVCTAKPDSETDRSVVELIRDHETTFSNKGRNESRISGKTHRTDESIFHADKFGDERLANAVQVTGTTGKPSTTGGDAIAFDGLFHGISTPSAGLSKAEIVVGRDVEGTGAVASEILSVVVVGRGTV